VTTLPTLTEAVDTFFTTTWYEIQKKAVDNILEANVISAALKAAGCFKKQSGERYIERTIRYGTKTAIAVAKGDTLPVGEDEIETAGHWKWKYLAAHIQRSLQDDQQNAGAGKIKSLVQVKTEAARDALDTKYEGSLIAAVDTGGGTELRAARDPYSLLNMLPGGSYYNQAPGSYTYGDVDTGTGNAWWQGQYATAVNPALMNLEDQMRTLFNDCSGGSGDFPDLIITNQTLFEIYEDLAGTKIQRTTSVGSRVADLGYDVLRYKGANVIWTPHADWPSGTMMMLNTKWIDVVYDPALWFSMTPWMFLPNQLERIARIVSTFTGPICYQLRRQGRLGAYTS